MASLLKFFVGIKTKKKKDSGASTWWSVGAAAGQCERWSVQRWVNKYDLFATDGAVSMFLLWAHVVVVNA